MSGKNKRVEYVSTIPSIQPPAVRQPAAPLTRSFVPAQDPGSAAGTPTRVEILPPAAPPETPVNQVQTRVQTVVTGSHTDRAQGFVLAVNRLGLTLGFLGIVVAVAGLRAPFWSLVTLAWFGSLYAGTWLIAYVLHVFISAEGAAWWNVWQGWAWLRSEQRHRHALERHINQLPERGSHTDRRAA